MVQILSPDGADQAFDEWVRAGGTNGTVLISSISSTRRFARQRWNRNSGSWSVLRCFGSGWPDLAWLNMRHPLADQSQAPIILRATSHRAAPENSFVPRRCSMRESRPFSQFVGYDRNRTRHPSGSSGWREHSPAALVTAVTPEKRGCQAVSKIFLTDQWLPRTAPV